MGGGQEQQNAALDGQVDMFSMFGGGDDDSLGHDVETPLPVVAEVGRRERLAWEKEAIGVFLSDHPAHFNLKVGGALARDVVGVARIPQQTVKDRFGIELEWEVKWLGDPKGFEIDPTLDPM